MIRFTDILAVIVFAGCVGFALVVHGEEYRASMDPVSNETVCPQERPNKRIVMDLTKPASCPVQNKLFCDAENCIYRQVQQACTPFETYAVCLTNEELNAAK